MLAQQLEAESTSPAGSNSQTPPTDAVRAAERSSGGRSRHGATGQSVNRTENVNRLYVTCYFKNASRNVQQKQAFHKQFYSIILTWNTLYNDLDITGNMYDKMYLLMKQKAPECMHTHR